MKMSKRTAVEFLRNLSRICAQSLKKFFAQCLKKVLLSLTSYFNILILNLIHRVCRIVIILGNANILYNLS